MDTLSAAARAAATRDDPPRVFDWEKAARLIIEHGAKRASAGLSKERLARAREFAVGWAEWARERGSEELARMYEADAVACEEAIRILDTRKDVA